MKQGIAVVEITTEANKEVGSRKVLVKSVSGFWNHACVT
jgi:hypothetical protein